MNASQQRIVDQIRSLHKVYQSSLRGAHDWKAAHRNLDQVTALLLASAPQIDPVLSKAHGATMAPGFEEEFRRAKAEGFSLERQVVQPLGLPARTIDEMAGDYLASSPAQRAAFAVNVADLVTQVRPLHLSIVNKGTGTVSQGRKLKKHSKDRARDTAAGIAAAMGVLMASLERADVVPVSFALCMGKMQSLLDSMNDVFFESDRFSEPHNVGLATQGPGARDDGSARPRRGPNEAGPRPDKAPRAEKSPQGGCASDNSCQNSENGDLVRRKVPGPPEETGSMFQVKFVPKKDDAPDADGLPIEVALDLRHSRPGKVIVLAAGGGVEVEPYCQEADRDDAFPLFVGPFGAKSKATLLITAIMSEGQYMIGQAEVEVPSAGGAGAGGPQVVVRELPNAYA